MSKLESNDEYPDGSSYSRSTPKQRQTMLQGLEEAIDATVDKLQRGDRALSPAECRDRLEGYLDEMRAGYTPMMTQYHQRWSLLIKDDSLAPKRLKSPRQDGPSRNLKRSENGDGG